MTEEASLNGTFKAKQWYVSWDKIGIALFKDQYSDTETVEGLQTERGEK